MGASMAAPKGSSSSSRSAIRSRGRPLYTFYQLPGIKAISDGLYAWVARNRYRWFGRTEDCEDGSCGVHVNAREAAAEERETTPSERPGNPA